MTADEIIRKLSEAVNRQDSVGLGSLYATTAVVVDPQYPEPLRGTDAIVSDYAEWFRAFPDTRLSFSALMVNGTTYAAEGTMTATHLGPLQGPSGEVSATNKPVKLGMAVFARLDNQGRIAEERRYFDLAGVMTELGALH